MEKIPDLLLRLVRGVLTDTPVQFPEIPDEDTLRALYIFSKKQDLAHLAAEGLKRAGIPIPEPLASQFRKQRMAAIYSDETKTRALEKIGQCLTVAGISYIPLKGAWMRSLYPQPWMRTRCDIDVLVHREVMGAAIQALEEIGYQVKGRWTRDVSLYSPEGIHLELHFTLQSSEDQLPIPFLDKVWEYAAPQGAGTCYAMIDAMFYCFHIGHMARHIRGYGCGIRMFLDLWLLEHASQADRPGRQAMLQEAGLNTFAAIAVKLVESWFGNGVCQEPVCQQLEEYVFSGGAFGKLENRYGNWNQAPKGVLLRQIFPTYSDMLTKYPKLEKHPWMYPLYQPIRWFRILWRREAGDRLRDWKQQADIYRDTHQDTKKFMETLGLWK